MLFNLTISTPSPLIALGTLVFNGTAVWLNGASVPGNINYDITLDGTLSEGTTAGNGPANLFAATGLTTTGTHTVSLTPASILDAVVLQMDLDADTEMTVDDSLLFSENTTSVQGSWVQNECLGSGRVNGTCHTSDGSGSVLSYEFQGDAITVWGSLENSRSRYSYSIDGAQALSTSSGANFTSSRPSIVLAHASSLGPGNHVITITSSPLDNVSRIEIDYVQLYVKESTSSSTSSSGSSTPYLSHTARIAIIVGSIAASVAIAVALLIVLLVRQKRQIARKEAQDRERSLGLGQFRTTTDLDALDSMYVKKTKEFDSETLASTMYSAPASFHPLQSKGSYLG